MTRAERHVSEFERCHTKNPIIYRLFERFTFDAINRGYQNFSADLVLHRVRWETSVDSGEDFKINNNYSAFYARLFMYDHPEYDGFFRCRESMADNWSPLFLP